MYDFRVGSLVVSNDDRRQYPEVMTIGVTRFINSHLMRFAFKGGGMRREWSKNVRHATAAECCVHYLRLMWRSVHKP